MEPMNPTPCPIPFTVVYGTQSERDLLIAILRRIRVPKKPFPSKSLQTALLLCTGESKRPDEMKILHRSKLAHILSEGRKFCPLLGIREVPWNSRTKTLGHSRRIGTECPLFGYETSVSLGLRKTKRHFQVTHFLLQCCK